MGKTLQSNALSGGVVLVGRQLFGMVLSVIGMLVITRLLGPQKYGQFAIVLGIMSYATNIGKLGLDVYLIRYQGDLGQRQIGVTQCLYLMFGVVLFILGILLGPLAAFWYKDPQLRNLFWTYAVVPPLTVMCGVPIAILDRQLLYKRAAVIELASQITYLAISLPIVWYSRSAWGLILGALGQTLLSLGMAIYLSKVRFHPQWDVDEAKAQLRYGVGYAASIWIWQGRDLVNPLLIGKLLGVEAVAFVSMAIRLAGMVGFAKSAVWRVYMSFLARLAHDREKMKEALEKGLSHQVIILAVSFMIFIAIAPEIIEFLMGARWLPILAVFPFIASGMIVNAGFSLHSSALYVIGKNHDVSIFHLIHLVLFIMGAWLATAKSGNITGYGWAEVAAFPSYFFIRKAFQQRLFIVKERDLFASIIITIFGIAVVTQLIDGKLWLRLLLSNMILAVLLITIPQNRVASLALLNKVFQRLSLNNT